MTVRFNELAHCSSQLGIPNYPTQKAQASERRRYRIAANKLAAPLQWYLSSPQEVAACRKWAARGLRHKWKHGNSYNDFIALHWPNSSRLRDGTLLGSGSVRSLSADADDDDDSLT